MATMRSAVGGVLLRRSGAARLPVLGRCRFSTYQGGHGETAQQPRTLLGYFAKKFMERYWAPMSPGEKIHIIGGLAFIAFAINKDIESSAILAEQKPLLAEKKQRQKNHDVARRYGRESGY